MKETAVILINVGTPNSYSVKDVRRYLGEFLNDPYVIDIPWILRKILVNLIIVPFRAAKSAKLYEKVWTDNGSPLLHISNVLTQKLQEKSIENTTFFIAMRYGNPSIKTVLKQIENDGYKKVILLPLYPQYTTSTTESSIQKSLKLIKKFNYKPQIQIIKQFYNSDVFISAFAKNIQLQNFETYDYILFSYHGLPIRHINKMHPEQDCNACNCTVNMPSCGEFCYKATCYKTTALLTEKLSIPSHKYSTSFQSRLSKNWITPFTDVEVENLAKKGVKKLLIVAPSFVTDCLETIIELGEEYKNIFLQNGGKEYTFVESLNYSEDWVDAVLKISKGNP